MEGQNHRLGAMMLLRSTVKRRSTRFAVTKNGEAALAGDIRVATPITPYTLITAVTILLVSNNRIWIYFRSLSNRSGIPNLELASIGLGNGEDLSRID